MLQAGLFAPPPHSLQGVGKVKAAQGPSQGLLPSAHIAVFLLFTISSK